jgi:phosphate-selective porin OprO and OprP
MKPGPIYMLSSFSFLTSHTARQAFGRLSRLSIAAASIPAIHGLALAQPTPPPSTGSAAVVTESATPPSSAAAATTSVLTAPNPDSKPPAAAVATPAPSTEISSPDGTIGGNPAPAIAAAAPLPSAPANETTAADEPSFKITGAPGQGLTISTGDAFSLNLKSRIQIRGQINTFEDEAKDAQQLVNIGTARVWLSGNLLKPELTYLIQLAVAGRDYRDAATSPIFDAYLEWKLHRDFSIRTGQYFVPFDRLRTVREWGLQMTDRPRPVQEFTLDRDVGVTFFSEKFLGDSSPVAWYLSAFGGRGTNQVLPSATGGLLTGRLELRPLGPIDDDREGDQDRREKPGLAIGGGFAHNFNTNRQRSTTGLTFAGGTTDDTYIAVDATFKWMGFALQAEYLNKRSSEDSFEIENDDGTTTTEYTRSGAGWILQASYAFDPPFEVVGRLSRLYAQSTLDPAFITESHKRGNEVAAGLNYYFNNHRLKAQASWVARTDSELKLGAADHQIAAQIDATF